VDRLEDPFQRPRDAGVAIDLIEEEVFLGREDPVLLGSRLLTFIAGRGFLTTLQPLNGRELIVVVENHPPQCVTP